MPDGHSLLWRALTVFVSAVCVLYIAACVGAVTRRLFAAWQARRRRQAVAEEVALMEERRRLDAITEGAIYGSGHPSTFNTRERSRWQ